jgi:hypothetical protein
MATDSTRQDSNITMITAQQADKIEKGATIPQEHNKFIERQGSRVHSGLQAHTTG